MSEKEPKLDLPVPYKVSTSIAKKLEAFEKNSKISYFAQGEEITETIFMLYLLKKYKSNCVAYNKETLWIKRPLGLDIELKAKYTKEEEKKILDHYKNIIEGLVSCIKKGINPIIIPFGFNIGLYGHANMLIYRMKNKEAVIEHFEPHGSEIKIANTAKRNEMIKQNLIFFVNLLNRELKKENLKTVTLVPSNEVCPYIEGLQVLEQQSSLKKNKGEPGGYCVSWSMFFAELCLRNPEIPSDQVLDLIYRYISNKPNVNDYLKKVIRGYTAYIYETTNRFLSIFFKGSPTTEYVNQRSERVKKVTTVLRILIEIEMRFLLNEGLTVEKELKRVKREYKEATKGMDKATLNAIKLTYNMPGMEKYTKIMNLYFEKRILQNYEEYMRYGRISEPLDIHDTPEDFTMGVLDHDIFQRAEIKEPVVKPKTAKTRTKKTTKGGRTRKSY